MCRGWGVGGWGWNWRRALLVWEEKLVVECSALLQNIVLQNNMLEM
jgi:hypothetical protein